MLLSSVAAAPCEIWFMLTLQTGKWLLLYVLSWNVTKCPRQSPRVPAVQHPPTHTQTEYWGGHWRVERTGEQRQEGASRAGVGQLVKQWHQLGGKY